MRVNRGFMAVVALCLGFATAQCSKGGKSSDITISVVPGQPIVITGDFIEPNSGAIAKAPWFQYSVAITNGSDEAVTIIGLNMVVTVATTNGGFKVVKQTILASNFNFTLNCANSVTAQITYPAFDTIPPGSTANLALTGPTLPSPDCTGLTATFNPAVFYSTGNPSVDTDNAISYNYTVQITPIGWFGTITVPDQRLERTVFFSTQ